MLVSLFGFQLPLLNCNVPLNASALVPHNCTVSKTSRHGVRVFSFLGIKEVRDRLSKFKIPTNPRWRSTGGSVSVLRLFQYAAYQMARTPPNIASPPLLAELRAPRAAHQATDKLSEGYCSRIPVRTFVPYQLLLKAQAWGGDGQDS